MRPVGQADRGGAARDLLHRHAMGEIAEARAAPLLFDRDAEETERAELRPQLARKAVGAVDLVGARRDIVLGESAHGIAQHFKIAAQAEIEAGQTVGQHGASFRGGAKSVAYR